MAESSNTQLLVFEKLVLDLVKYFGVPPIALFWDEHQGRNGLRIVDEIDGASCQSEH